MEHRSVNKLKILFYIVILCVIVLFGLWRFKYQGLVSVHSHFTLKQSSYILGILGAICLAVSYCLKQICKNDSGIRYLAIIAIMLSNWIYLRAGTVSAIYDNSKMIITIKLALVLLLPLPIVWFFYDFLERRYYNVFLPFMIIPLLSWLMCMLALNFFDANQNDLYLSGQIITISTILLCLYHLIKDAIRYKWRNAYFMMIVVCNALVICVFEIVYLYNRDYEWIDVSFGYVTFFTILFILLIAGNDAIRKYKENEKVRFHSERDLLVNKINAEFHKPLKNILNNNKYIIDNCFDEEIYSKAAEIEFSGNNMNAMIQNMSDCVKLEYGQLGFHFDEIYMTNILNDLINRIFPLAEAKNIELKINVQDDMPKRVCGDPAWMERILATFLDNAVKFTEEGYISFQVGFVPLSEERIKMFVTIEDSGVGFDSKLMKKLNLIFENIAKLDKPYLLKPEKRNEYLIRKANEYLDNDFSFDSNIDNEIIGVGYGIQTVIMLAQKSNTHITIESNKQRGTKVQLSNTFKVADADPIGDFQNWYIIKENSYQKFKRRKAMKEKKEKEMLENARNIAYENGKEIKENQGNSLPSKEELSILINGGVHVIEAQKYVADDFGQYIELLKMFPQKTIERQKALKEYLESEDYENYTILVHALKNNARTLGADRLADLAYEHEKESGKHNSQYICGNLGELVIEWKRVDSVFRQYLDKYHQDIDTNESVQELTDIDDTFWKENVQKIAEYLDTFKKKEALQILGELKNYRLTENQGKIVDDVLQAVNRYDYAGAIDIIQKNS